MDTDIKNIDSQVVFRKKLLIIIRPLENDTYAIYDPLAGFSNLKEHKFRHNFTNTLNPLCPCSVETEDTEHYFLRCQNNLHSSYESFKQYQYCNSLFKPKLPSESNSLW